jgi:uncharacterized membrane protein YbaN (DUF454 family)
MVFTILGFVFMGIGIIGIFLPILPTTPFLILAALLFAKGNSRFATVLLKNKYLAAYINNYRNKVGVPIKTKITSLVFLWGAAYNLYDSLGQTTNNISSCCRWYSGNYPSSLP